MKASPERRNKVRCPPHHVPRYHTVGPPQPGEARKRCENYEDWKYSGEVNKVISIQQQ